MSRVKPQRRTTFLSPTTKRLLSDLPPFVQDSTDAQGTMDALAMELDRIDAAIREIAQSFFPHAAETYLHIWEMVLGIAENPPDKTLAQRQASAAAFMQALNSNGTGIEWQAAMTEAIGSGWTYEEHIPGDPGSPPENVIRITIPYSPELDPPANLVATVGGGGTLAAGTYHYAVTAANFYGETTISNEDDVTVGASGSVELEWDDVPGATQYRVYRRTGAATFRLIEVVATSDFEDAGEALGTEGPPTTNTSQSFYAYEAALLARRITPAHLGLIFGYDAGFLIGISQIGVEPL